MKEAGLHEHEPAADQSRDEEPMLLVGPDQTVSYANPAAHKLLGYAMGALGGLSLKWLSPPSRHGELRNIEALFTGQSTRRIRSVVLCADGKSLDVALMLEPCTDESGQVVAVSIKYEVLPVHTSMVVPKASLTPRLTSQPPRAIPTLPPRGISTLPPRSGSRPVSGPAPSVKRESVREEAPTQPVRVRVPPHGPNAFGVRPPVPPPPANDVAPRGVRGEELGERLESTLQLLSWLDQRFTSANDLSLDDARERARLHVVLTDARALVQECRRDVEELFPAIPRAPAIPRLR
jgi:PAS domain S-box-containing protein